jgi:hypothetical protein
VLQGVPPLTDEEMLRFARLQLEAAVSVLPNGERSFSCPDPRCGLLMISDDPTPRRERCPHCHSAVMCGACGLDWERSKHALFTDAAGCAKALHHLQSNEEAESLARGEDTAGTFKPCPICRMALTHYRSHGCHSINCPRCRAQFCYACLRVDCPNSHTWCSGAWLRRRRLPRPPLARRAPSAPSARLRIG